MTRWLAILLLLGGLSTVAPAQSAAPAGVLGNLSEVDLLPPDQAFQFDARVRGSVLRLEARVAEGYYLYRDRLKFAADTAGLGLGAALMPEGEVKDDPLFGKVQAGETSHDQASARGGAQPDQVDLHPLGGIKVRQHARQHA